MNKIIERILVTALVTLTLAVVMPKAIYAQDEGQPYPGPGPYTSVCNNSEALAWPFPDEDPCQLIEGRWVGVEFWGKTGAANGKEFGKVPFDTYAEMIEAAHGYTGGSAWFETGEGTTEAEVADVEDTTSDEDNTADGSENTPPKAWTKNVCNGSAAIVYQAVTEDGDGVTVKVDDPMGCAKDSAWFVVEPWGRSGFNPDAGCLASNWAAVGKVAKVNNWPNGSAWRVDSSYGENPVVVDCAEVKGGETLGLNRYENQVRLSRLPWVLDRAQDLLKKANMHLADYCLQYGSEPLGEQILCTEFVTTK